MTTENREAVAIPMDEKQGVARQKEAKRRGLLTMFGGSWATGSAVALPFEVDALASSIANANSTFNTIFMAVVGVSTLVSGALALKLFVDKLKEIRSGEPAVLPFVCVDIHINNRRDNVPVQQTEASPLRPTS